MRFLLLLLCVGLWAQKPTPPALEEKLPLPPPAQPIPYSHKIHLALGMKCANCHAIPDPGFQVTFPRETVCMGCHSTIRKDSASIQKLAEFARSKQPVPWARIYTVPKIVWFSHAVHAEEARIECESCHGPVKERDVMFKEKPTNMTSCMACHAKHNAPNGCDVCHNSQ